MGLLDSALFPSRCFRRDSPNAMMETDSTIGEITRAAGRGAAGFKSYLAPRNVEEAFTDSDAAIQAL